MESALQRGNSILMLGFKVQTKRNSAMERNMCKSNEVLQKIKLHSEEKYRSSEKKIRAESQKDLVRILA